MLLAKGQWLASHAAGQALQIPALDRWASPDVEARADPFFREMSARKRVMEGTVFAGEDVVRRADLVATDFYKQWWQPNDIGHLCCGIMFNDTFKTQLNQAYAKSQTHRQADLLKLLLSLVSH